MNNVVNKTLCLIEDDPIMGESLSDRLVLEGLQCDWYREGGSALDALRQNSYAMLISDIRLPDLDGEQLFATLTDENITLPPTLFITGYGSIDQAVRLMRLGARDYITKPFNLDDLLEKLRVISPRLFIDEDYGGTEAVLGASITMQRIQKMLQLVAEHRVGVVISGESGVGKEYAARYLHTASDQTGSLPFIAVNCAALPESLLEAELFGHEKGAFTGAMRMHRGVFERANGGTLFLDEISEMSPAMQAKLLRVVQDGVFERVGGHEQIEVDVRLICATNRDLKAMVDSGNFREDLFYRIHVAHIHVPPLRERADDILWFARLFVGQLSEKHSKKWTLTSEAEQYLLRQKWPGNVRQLKHTIDRACIFSQTGMLGAAELGASTQDQNRVTKVDTEPTELRAYLERCERIYILETLEIHGWRMSETAENLRISRKNLWEKMRKYGIRNAGVDH